MIREDDRDQAGPGDDLAGPLVRRPVPDDRQCEKGIEELPVRGDQGEEERAEGDEHEPVSRPDLGPLQHAGVPKSLSEHVPPPLARMITSAGGGLAELDDADDRCHAAGEQQDTYDRDGQCHDDRDDLHLSLLLGALRPQPNSTRDWAIATLPVNTAGDREVGKPGGWAGVRPRVRC